jgi:hypothetical protein
VEDQAHRQKLEIERQHNRTLATVARRSEQRYPSSPTNFVLFAELSLTRAKESVDRFLRHWSALVEGLRLYFTAGLEMIRA